MIVVACSGAAVDVEAVLVCVAKVPQGRQESLADAKVSARHQCVYEDP